MNYKYIKLPNENPCLQCNIATSNTGHENQSRGSKPFVEMGMNTKASRLMSIEMY